jgi:hypothetical protein
MMGATRTYGDMRKRTIIRNACHQNRYRLVDLSPKWLQRDCSVQAGHDKPSPTARPKRCHKRTRPDIQTRYAPRLERKNCANQPQFGVGESILCSSLLFLSLSNADISIFNVRFDFRYIDRAHQLGRPLRARRVRVPSCSLMLAHRESGHE